MTEQTSSGPELAHPAIPSALAEALQTRGQPVQLATARSKENPGVQLEPQRDADLILARILDTAAAGLTRCSRDLRYTSANRAYAELLGVPVENIIGRPIVELMGEKGFEVIKPFTERVLRGERVQFETEIPYLSSGPRVVHVTYSPDITSNGQIVGWVASVVDITERKRAEQALRESEMRLLLAKDAARFGIFDWDISSGTLTWDDRMRELWGFPPGCEVTRELAYARVHADDRDAVRLAVDRALDPAGSGRFSAEYRIVPVNGGGLRWVAAAGQALFSDGKAVRIAGAVQDITERKEFQSELERLVAERTAQLQELITELEHFSFTITHDMRAPLRAMHGFAEAALEVNSSDPEEQERLLRRVVKASKRMDLLIVDALRYSNAVRQRLNVVEVNVSKLLTGMVESYPEFQVRSANITIQPDMPPVLGNEAGLTQCFSNLLNNALKFVGPDVTPEVHVFAENTNDTQPMVHICVQDNGIGVSPQMMPRLFQMFTRGSADYEGTGIGLALVRKVVDRMGGRVGVESAPGRGSRFWIELRPAPASAPLATEPARDTRQNLR